MAITVVRSINDLADGVVLAPERYDGRRTLVAHGNACRLGDIARVQRTTVKPSKDLGACWVLDASDAREGVIVARKPAVSGDAIGSHKKAMEVGDVIISRLRPYLRQVALVDVGAPVPRDARILGSTEFLVLRAVDGDDIAFLVPYLLSPDVQRALAAAQEGGHHPRFSEAVLHNLPLPHGLLAHRTQLSDEVRSAVRSYRRFAQRLGTCVTEVTRALGQNARASASSTLDAPQRQAATPA